VLLLVASQLAAGRGTPPRHGAQESMDEEGAMHIKQIIAIFPREYLEPVEEALRRVNVERIDVCKVRGYGEYPNFYARDWMVDEVRVDIFTRADEVETLTRRS
jgi:hypothetical protein